MNANIFALPSALWLVDDSAAVGLRHAWTRDRMMSFGEFFQVVLLLFFLMSILSFHGCYKCTYGHPHIPSHGPLKTSSHFAVRIHVSPILTRWCCGKPSEVVPSFPFGGGASWLLRRGRCSLDSALMCISLDDETGLQWEDYLFELQNAVEWRMVMSRGQDERSQMHAMSLLLNTCDDMTNGVLIDDGARWILEGDEQEQPVSQLSQQYAGVDICWLCEGARETRAQ